MIAKSSSSSRPASSCWATTTAVFVACLTSSSRLTAVVADAPTCPSHNPGCQEAVQNEESCRLYLAPAAGEEEEEEEYDPEEEEEVGPWALYSATFVEAGQPLTSSPERLLAWLDPNQNEYSAWDEIAWSLQQLDPFVALDSDFLSGAVVPGISSLAACVDTSEDVNLITANAVFLVPQQQQQQAITKDGAPAADWQVVATRDIWPGEEIRVDCQRVVVTNVAEAMLQGHEAVDESDRMLQSPAWLASRGTCVYDGGMQVVVPAALQKENSKVTDRVEATRPFGTGQVLVTSPVVVVDASQMERVQQAYRSHDQYDALRYVNFVRSHGIDYTASHVLGQQMALDVCWGHVDSQVLLLPVAPVVTRLRAQDDKQQQQANVGIRFAKDQDYFLDMPLMELLDLRFGSQDTSLFVEYVALMDIAPGDELVLATTGSLAVSDDERVVPVNDENTVRPKDLVLKTVKEQHVDPYPAQVHTVCQWSEEAPFGNDCVRPCELVMRQQQGSNDDNDVLYTARIFARPNDPEDCGTLIGEEGLVVTDLSAKSIRVIYRPYQAPYLHASRHAMGVPEGLYPKHWMAADTNPTGDFIGSRLAPGAMAPIRWKGSAKVVTPWAFRVGVPASVRQVLLDYCDKMGIIDIFRHVTVQGNGLPPDNDVNMVLPGPTNWFLQRPAANWRSNLHWLSPLDNPAHEHYLQALGASGFDEVLKGVGDYLGMDGLVAFHVTFIAVSHSTRGFLHHDVLETGAKTYNVIVPLMLVNETGPELDLVDVGPDLSVEVSEEDYKVGRYRYEYEVGSMMGDGAIHATSAVDYRRHKQMRMAATIYIADVRDWNAKGILNEYTQAYPPREKSLLMSWAGRHWKRDDPTVTLPRPNHPSHVLYDAATTE